MVNIIEASLNEIVKEYENFIKTLKEVSIKVSDLSRFYKFYFEIKAIKDSSDEMVIEKIISNNEFLEGFRDYFEYREMIILVIDDKDKDKDDIENIIYDNDLKDLNIRVEYIGIESKRNRFENRVIQKLECGEKCEINGVEIKSLKDLRKITEKMDFR
ncbi:hypothetical protein [Pseudobacteroides cellulosolvens]|uniref:Uncharacterized protein n=1 Tax=Pseudobacteroides cellulosolvens ATCC 35603 = DSM 2933 TaxID=398512 RepID=A0A0L6JPE8_9FIRM|nr:hypothetical protein [Pseudobacteroides cellulosolvens]KNY27590.1 hypothetical protein Bccel_2861 [Pseudobacteroides cellulosolvens ATCC 35603 = DSM 2933]